MADRVDVLVIGAGPAGSIATSVIHQAGLTVKIVEREKFPRFVIGESLLPRCMEVLDRTGLLDAVEACNFQRKAGAKFMRGSEIADFNFAEQFSEGWSWTWQVPRAEFDQALAKAVEAKGVEIEFETTVKAIEFHQDGSSTTTVQCKDGSEEKIEARFIVDASGYGRVIPRLFNLDKPSVLDSRRALFAHVHDSMRNEFDEPNRITIILYSPGVWVWIIPFSTGITSVGFVGSPEFFDSIPGEIQAQFARLIKGNAHLQQRFASQSYVIPPRKLESWSTTTETFFGDGFVLTGNVTEFLDPIFSSGVMFATVSAFLAATLVVRKFRGEQVNWESEYSGVMQQGIDTFRTFVTAWYDGTLEKIFFAKHPDPQIKRQICSVLAGYVWDQKNPFVRNHSVAVQRLARLIDVQSNENDV